MSYYRHGFLPKGLIFSVFYEKMRDEAIALFNLFYYAKDFETFYKTAAWARYHLNEGMFTYSFSIAVIHRPDTQGIILPAPYELYPHFFVNSEVIEKMMLLKMQQGLIDDEVARYYVVSQEENDFVVYSNYSGNYAWTSNTERRIAYFTEDIGLNTYYYYFHTLFPFWMSNNKFGRIEPYTERRGEYYYYFHQQLLARYYLERLTNGMGEIPDFSWRWPVKTGYYPNMIYRTGTPFPQRSNYYHPENPDNIYDLKFIESYESNYIGCLTEGEYKGVSCIINSHMNITYINENVFNSNLFFQFKQQVVNLRKPKSINFVGNYWQSNFAMHYLTNETEIEDYETYNGYYNKYYEVVARSLLGGSPNPIGE